MTSPQRRAAATIFSQHCTETRLLHIKIVIRTGLAGGRSAVQAVGHKRAATRSTKHITDDVCALGVAIDDNVRARALLLERSNLRDAVAGALCNLGAVVSAERDVELDVHVVASLALGRQLAARGLDKGERPPVVVRRIVAAGHEDDYIGAGSVELGRRGLRRGEGGEGAQSERVADAEGHHYVLNVYKYIFFSLCVFFFLMMNECGLIVVGIYQTTTTITKKSG